MAATGQGYQQAKELEAEASAKDAGLQDTIAKMRQMAQNGAPDDVLRRYLEAKGFTEKDLTQSLAGDVVAKNFRGGAFGGAINQALMGAAMGYGDEAAAGVKAALTAPFTDETIGQAYSRNLENFRRNQAAFETAYPKTATGLTIAGAAAPIVLTAGGAAVPQTLGQATLRSAGTGAAYGGLSGFGASEGGFENRLKGAATGAAIGGIAGAAIPPALTGAKRLIDRVRAALGVSNADDMAVQKVLQYMARDKMTPEDAAKKYADTLALDPTKPVTLADVAGENTRRLADQAFLTPGQSADDVARFIEERQAGQPARVQADIAKFLPDENLYATKDSLIAKRSTEAGPLYERAFAQPVNITKRMTRFLDDPITQAAYERGIEIQRLEAIARGRPFLNRAGEELIRNNPNMRMMDAVKRGLDDIIESYRDSTTGVLRLDQRGRAIDEFRRAWVNELDEMNPLYSEARKAWSGPSQAMDAMAMGRGIFDKDAEITQKMLFNMPQGDRDFFRLGVFRSIMDRIGRAPDGADVLKRFFNSPQLRARLRAAFPSKDEFEQFTRLMGVESTMFKTGQQIMGNSKTAQRLFAAADASGEDLSTAGNLIMGRWGDALRSFARKTVAKMGGMRPEVSDKIAQIILTGTPAEVLAALRGLQAGTPAQVAATAPVTGGAIPALAGAGIGSQTRYGR